MSNPHKELASPDQTVSGKDSSNPLMADNLPKIVWYSTTLMKSWLVQKQTTLGKDKANPLIVDGLLKTIWSSLHHLLINEVLTILGKTTIGKEISNPFMAGSLPKTILLTFIHVASPSGQEEGVITEATIRDALHLDDAEGVECLPNEEIFADVLVPREPHGMSLVHQWHVMSYAYLQEVEEGDADENVENVNAGDVAKGDVSATNDEVPTAAEEPSIPSPTPPTPPPQPSQDIPSTSQRINSSDDNVMDDVSNQERMIAGMDADADGVLEEAKDVADDIVKDVQNADVKESAHDQGRQAETQVEIYKIDLDHATKVLSMQEDESKPTEVQEVVEVVTTAKLITKVVTAASTTITVVKVLVPAATTAAAPILTATPRRRTKGLVIRDPEESTTTTSIIIHSEAKSKDKGKGILAKEDPTVKRYQALKRKPKTETQAKKNMMLYLKNVAGFKMDYFKGMSYDDIRPIFEEKFNSNVAFLQKTKEQIEKDESRALKRINETSTEKAAKRQKLDKIITFTTTQLILLVERKYPLTRFTLDQMLNAVRLEVEEESEVSLELLRSNDVVRLQALIDRKKVIITEDTIRQAFRLDDAAGVDCLPNEEIFAELARMGYEKPRKHPNRGEIAELEANEDVTLVDAEEDMNDDVQGRLAESQAKVYHSDLQHAKKVLSMQDTDEAEPAKVEDVIEVVTAAKLMKEVVTTATTITAAQVPKASATWRRRGVVIQDRKEIASASVIVHTEVKKNMMIYLKNMAGFKMDFFKGMTYNEIRPIFEKHYNLNQAFLERVEEEVTGQKEEGSKRKGESLNQDATKKQMKNEKEEELKAHLQIVVNDDDDVFTEATPLAFKVLVIDYQIHHENNKTYYKIIKADGTHKLFISFITLMKNFNREDLEMI
nr:hypothetical protein [Tanacetum cinerariifolium]